MVKKCMLIDASTPQETRIAVLQDSQLVDFDSESNASKPLKGNIYLGKIVRIEPSLQAAFVEYGRNRHGFLAFTEIHPDYFRIPVADRESALQVEEEKESNGSEGEVEQILNKEESEKEPENGEIPAEDIAEAADVSEEEVRKKFALYRNYKIQEVINSRQIVLVQVVKEERGNKGAALTTFVSLAGRYSVLMPNALNAGGISRKITDNQHRKRLRDLLKALGVPDGMSLIIRTAGLDRSKIEIKRDYSYLIKLWAQIREETLKATAPALIYEEGSLTRRALRDIYTPEMEEIWVQGENAFKEAKEFLKTIIPSQVKRIKHYKEAEGKSLFQQYKIEQQIEQVYASEVKLPSGGYLVINATEALVAIDVNSGQATRERHIDSTALKTNLEAAEEIARQLRLRDLAGLLVIDFIDMSDIKHNISVERKLKECLATDRARIQVGRISQFGLLEMSRQRLRPSVMEAVAVRCSYCMGAGFMRSKESLCLQLLRVLEEVSFKSTTEKLLKVKVATDLGFFLLSEKRKELAELEARRGNFFEIIQDDSVGARGFRIEDSHGNFLVDSVGGKRESKDHDKKLGKHDHSKRQDKRKRHNKKEKNVPSGGDSGEVIEEIKEVIPIEVSESEEMQPAMLAEETQPSPHNNRKRQRNRRRHPKNKEGRNAHNGGPVGGNGNVEEDLPDDVNGNVLEESPLHPEYTVQGDEKPSRKKSRSGWWKKILDN